MHLLGRGQGRANLDAAQRHAFLLVHDLFKSAAVFAPAFDDFFHYPLRPLGLARADGIADVDNPIVVLDNPDPSSSNRRIFTVCSLQCESAPIFATTAE